MLLGSGWECCQDTGMWEKEGCDPIPPDLYLDSTVFSLAGQIKFREYIKWWMQSIDVADTVSYTPA